MAAPSVDLQCADAAIAGETEAVGQLSRTAIESAGHFHDDDRAPILLRAFERFRRDAILCAGFLFPRADRVRIDDSRPSSWTAASGAKQATIASMSCAFCAAK
jgi:hypothetical protein